MRKIIFAIVFFACIANEAGAQLSVYSDGKVGIGTPSSVTPVSTLSIVEGKEGYEAAVKGSRRGIFGLSEGQYLNWSYGLYGKSLCSHANFQTGVAGVSEIEKAQSSGRTYGVLGIAGNATSGWNYGVYGQLNGTNNGAGVYGTATHRENGSCVDGRYAGYFNGATKVNGNLTVTGSISGVLINKASNSSVVTALSEENNDNAFSDRLSKLSATCYYVDDCAGTASAMNAASDTASVVSPASEILTLAAERKHYGLDIEKLRECFPELVYEQKDGTVGVNYIEMIPVLVLAINSLSAEVKALKAAGAYPSPRQSDTVTGPVAFGADGKAVGIKRR